MRSRRRTNLRGDRFGIQAILKLAYIYCITLHIEAVGLEVFMIYKVFGANLGSQPG